MIPLIFFFFNDTATTEIYTLSLHDALPICTCTSGTWRTTVGRVVIEIEQSPATSTGKRPSAKASSTCPPDRKSTRLNSSHANISYAVFCLKKKKENIP